MIRPSSPLTMLLSRHTRRREFITLLGGAAAAWPLAARAQQGERLRRIGVLMSTAAGDVEGRARIAAFLDELQKFGWIDGRSARIDTRWPTSMQEVRKYSAELVGLAPDVLLATGSASLADFLEATRTVPIVFVNVGDPVGGRLRVRRTDCEGGSPRVRHTTARIRHLARRRGCGVAARCARAAGRAGTARRRTPARNCGRCGISGPVRSVLAGAGAIGLDHWPQRSRRDPLGYGQCR